MTAETVPNDAIGSNGFWTERELSQRFPKESFRYLHCRTMGGIAHVVLDCKNFEAEIRLPIPCRTKPELIEVDFRMQQHYNDLDPKTVTGFAMTFEPTKPVYAYTCLRV